MLNGWRALLRKRRNVYGFLSKPVPDRIILKILEDALHVPSAGFTQDFDLVVVQSQNIREKLAEASHQSEYEKEGLALPGFISTAPVLVVPCANRKRFEAKYGRADNSARLPWWLIDAGFASFAMILSAFESGVAASFLGAIDEEKVAELLNLPPDGSVIPLAVVPIGYADPMEKRHWAKRLVKVASGRRPLSEMVHWEKW